MRKISSVVLTIVLVCAVMAVTAPYAQAAGTSIHISGVTIGLVNCTGQLSVNFDIVVRVPSEESAEIWFSVTAPGASNPANYLSNINALYGGPPVYGPEVMQENVGLGTNIGGPLAPNTDIVVRYYDVNSDAYSTITVNCTTGAYSVYNQASAKTEKEEPYTGIFLLNDDVTVPYASIPNANGTLPCGVFDVNGWGTKYIGLADFPACTPPVDVMCLNGEGQWTADNVSNVVIRGDYEVDFDSSQDGTCAFFPSS